ncbi:hypothetical protein V5799_000189, partial [Amblyomma americanum]
SHLTACVATTADRSSEAVGARNELGTLPTAASFPAVMCNRMPGLKEIKRT